MTFPGHPPKAPEVPAPLRTYTFKRWGGAEVTIEAHYLQFTAGHVNFWKTREGEKQDTLIFSEVNQQVTSLKEVTS